MDRDNDVLFLALSSHGRRDSRLVVKNGALPLNYLSARELDLSGLLAKPVAHNKLVEAVDLAFAHQVSLKRHQDYLRAIASAP